MSFKVVFTGLCAVVRQRGKLRVLLPNFTDTTLVHGQIVPQHLAYIQYRQQAVIQPLPKGGPPQRPPEALIANDGLLTEYACFFLAGEHITIKAMDVTNVPLSVDDSQIIEMDNVVKEHQLDDSLVSDDFDPEVGRVLGWVDVTEGKLYVQDAPHVLEFRPKIREKPYRKLFAESVVWELAPGNYSVNVRSFGASQAKPLWEIDATASVVTFLIGNLPPEDIMNPTSARVRDRDFDLVDHHFHRFYELCATPPSVHPLPHRISARTLKTRLHGGNCPPVLFTL